MSKTLSIRFTSDTHGYLYPTSYADSVDRPMGLMKLAAAFPHDGNTLIIDGGDTIQGSPMTNLYHRLSHEEQAACLTRDDHGANLQRREGNLQGDGVFEAEFGRFLQQVDLAGYGRQRVSHAEVQFHQGLQPLQL